MKVFLGCVALSTIALLAGCAQTPDAGNKPVVIEYLANGPDLAGLDRRGVGSGSRFRASVGESEKMDYPPFEFRECNEQKTSCALGLGSLQSVVTLLGIEQGAAKIQVTLSHKVGASQTLAGVTKSLPAGVPVITDQENYARTVVIPFGENRHVALKHGVDFAICVSESPTEKRTVKQCSGLTSPARSESDVAL